MVEKLSIGNQEWTIDSRDLNFTDATLNSFFEKVSGTELKVDYLPPTENDPKQRKPDIRLAWEKLGFKPVIDLETGIQKTMEYFRTFNAI